MGASEFEGGFDAWGDADAVCLWRACQPDQQQEIADRFAVAHADGVRDALLDAQDALAAPAAAGKDSAAILARAIWREWSVYRDRSVEDLHRRGRLRLESSRP
ncbi:MAG: hypothetical protein ABSF29_04430 [Tepidisphaeraceae bacterium]|jgi:hypothetical protein